MVTEVVISPLIDSGNKAFTKKGVIMKRLISIIALIVFVFGLENVTAQKGISFQVSYYSDTNAGRYANKDIREFHAFRKDLDDFYEVALRDRVRKSKRIKKDILRRMRNEVNDTKNKIRYVKYELDYSNNQGLRKKGTRGNEYSKRNGNTGHVSYKTLAALQRQLNKQSRIVVKLENMYLNDGRNFFEQARRHQKLMEDFADILKDDINYSFKEYRNRNRRGR